MAESDPRRAIGILHQVLRYGRATIYALKAYSELGSCYERLGNRRRALSCYDRALALAEDEPYTHARRGLLLDACGDHAAALIALETSLAALETSPAADAMRLNEEFWEKVERRLHELRQRPV